MSVKSNIGVVTDGLVFYVDAGNADSYPGSGTTWSDLVGNSNGSMVNMDATNYSSTNGGLFSFDGSNERFDLSQNIFNGLSNSGITVEAWVNFNNSSGVELILGTWTNTASNDQVGLFLVNSTIGLGVADGSTAETSTKTNSLYTNTWYHIMGTWNTNRTINMYVNGTLDNTGTQVGNGYNSSSTGTSRS